MLSWRIKPVLILVYYGSNFKKTLSLDASLPIAWLHEQNSNGNLISVYS